MIKMKKIYLFATMTIVSFGFTLDVQSSKKPEPPVSTGHSMAPAPSNQAPVCDTSQFKFPTNVNDPDSINLAQKNIGILHICKDDLSKNKANEATVKAIDSFIAQYGAQHGEGLRNFTRDLKTLMKLINQGPGAVAPEKKSDAPSERKSGLGKSQGRMNCEAFYKQCANGKPAFVAKGCNAFSQEAQNPKNAKAMNAALDKCDEVGIESFKAGKAVGGTGGLASTSTKGSPFGERKNPNDLLGHSANNPGQAIHRDPPKK
jgi:hypothetical protein